MAIHVFNKYLYMKFILPFHHVSDEIIGIVEQSTS
jgi:hypothetical protein